MCGPRWRISQPIQAMPEISLGDDYIAVLRQYAELHEVVKMAASKFGDVITK